LQVVKLRHFNYHDIGDISSYAEAKLTFNNDIVAPKNDEALFIDNGTVIKYFHDSQIITNRVNRINYLNNTVPNVHIINENMYSYDFINGVTLSKILDTSVLSKFLPYWYDMLGSKKLTKDDNFINNCKKMYIDKTYSRCGYFSGSDIDNIEKINGVTVLPINIMLDKIEWELVIKCAIPSYFHGDLQPENVIYDKSFKLIDWRESFGDSLEIGDSYYDLGKLYHALLINGDDIKRKMYKLNISGSSATVSHYTRSNLLFMLDELKEFCRTRKYSWENVKLLGCLQYLSIASLYNEFHDGEYGRFLFLYGKYLLAKINMKSDIRDYNAGTTYE
jgi:thiamine kinase-like enzyme